MGILTAVKYPPCNSHCWRWLVFFSENTYTYISIYNLYLYLSPNMSKYTLWGPDLLLWCTFWLSCTIPLFGIPTQLKTLRKGVVRLVNFNRTWHLHWLLCCLSSDLPSLFTQISLPLRNWNTRLNSLGRGSCHLSSNCLDLGIYWNRLLRNRFLQLLCVFNSFLKQYFTPTKILCIEALRC